MPGSNAHFPTGHVQNSVSRRSESNFKYIVKLNSSVSRQAKLNQGKLTQYKHLNEGILSTVLNQGVRLMVKIERKIFLPSVLDMLMLKEIAS